MSNTDRRTFIKRGLLGGAVGLYSNSVFAHAPTPAEAEGPFYPVLAQQDKDLDLTQVEGQQGIAKGKIIIVQGEILDTDNQPIESATVEIWQANAVGRYKHPHDKNEAAPLDPNFQGWAVVPSGKQGAFHFITIYPGAYPATDT